MFRVKGNPDCTKCGLAGDAKTVCLMGRGPRDTDIMVIGEAPGRNEDELGKPFVGRAGSELTDALKDAGIPRKRVYVTNAVKCRPPGNRTPKKSEINKCKEYLDKEFKRIKPKYVLLVGNVALIAVTGKAGIKKRRGVPFEKDGVVYLPTYHPAYVARDDRARPAFEADLRYFAEIVEKGGIPREEGLDWTIVDTWDKVRKMAGDIKGTVSFDLETSSDNEDLGGLYPWAKGARIASLGIGTKRHQWCIPLKHSESPWSDADIKKILRKVNRRIRHCTLVAHNAKFDSLWMLVKYGYKWLADFDTMLAHYLCNENSFHDLKYLAQIFYGAPNYDVDKDVKQDGPLYQHCEYLAHDVYYTRKLRWTLGRMLRDDTSVYRLWNLVMMPIARMFVDVEYHGVYIDVESMAETQREYERQRDQALIKLEEFGKVWTKNRQRDLDKIKDPDEYKKELRKFKESKGQINWGSTQQLAKLLFQDLGIKPLEKTGKGAPSTKEAVLLQIEHPIADLILKWREAEKNLGTFIEGWKGFLENNWLHPTFKLHGTVTGRPSCKHPNLQQVPRNPLLRALVSAPDGWELIEIDLSQIEMRVAAELSGDPVLRDIFLAGQDVHWITAIREIARGKAMKKEVLSTARKKCGRKVKYREAIDILLEMGVDEATSLNPCWKEVRKKAKAINFGYLFGMWWKKFKIYARDKYGVHLTDAQAQESRKAYFELYAGLPAWHQRQRRYARRNGRVRCLSGRLRRLPAAMSSHDSPQRREAERQAINSPVQGFANDLNLMVALQLKEEFGDRLRICGTVHDAVLFMVRTGDVLEVAERADEIMRWPKLLDELGVKMGIPIKGDVKIGPWSRGVSIEQWRKQCRSTSRKSKHGGRVGKSTGTSTSKRSSRKKSRGHSRSGASPTA